MQPLPRLRPLRSDLGIGALRPQLAVFACRSSVQNSAEADLHLVRIASYVSLHLCVSASLRQLF